MLYLLNVTMVWLVCLILFEVLLRRETYHAYNRAYLLLTLILGLLLPLWDWTDTSVIANTELRRPAEAAYVMKRAVVSSVPEHTVKGIDASGMLLYIYLAGIVSCSLFLLYEIFLLIRLYKNGSKNRMERWVIIETGRQHSPFSIFRTVFVRSRKEYTPQQWDML